MSSNFPSCDQKFVSLPQEILADIRISNSIDGEMRENSVNLHAVPSKGTDVSDPVGNQCKVCGSDKEVLRGIQVCRECHISQVRDVANLECVLGDGKCQITVSTRMVCSYCRHKKYAEIEERYAGPRPAGEQCKVCGSDKEVLRGIQVCRECQISQVRDVANLKCVLGDGKCEITVSTRMACSYCRHKKYAEIEERYADNSLPLREDKTIVESAVPYIAKYSRKRRAPDTDRDDPLDKSCTISELLRSRMRKKKKCRTSSQNRDTSGPNRMSYRSDELEESAKTNEGCSAENLMLPQFCPLTDCIVCGAATNCKYHTGAICYSCEQYYNKFKQLDCPPKCSNGDGKCEINMETRSNCKLCRYEKCKKLVFKSSERETFVRSFGASESFDMTVTSNSLRAVNKLCKVCGDSIKHGVLMCQSCQKFYRKHNRPHCSLECFNGNGKCRINKVRRRSCCKSCRFEKCKKLDFKKTARPKISHYVCAVCEGGAEGMHYGVIACDSCAIFFRRNSHEKFPPECTENCKINDQTRRDCKYCRLKKCRDLGMMKNGLTRKQAEDVDDSAVTTIEDKPDDVDSQSKNSLDPIVTDKLFGGTLTLSAKDVVLEDPHQTPIGPRPEETSIRRPPSTDSDVPTDENVFDDVDSQTESNSLLTDKQLDGTPIPSSQEQPVECVSSDLARETPMNLNNSDGRTEADLFAPGILDKEDDNIEFRMEETLYNGPDHSALSLRSLNIPDYLSETASPGADVNAEIAIPSIEAVACNEEDDNVQLRFQKYDEPDSPFSNDMEYADHVEHYEEESSIRRPPPTDNDVPTDEDKPNDVDSRTNSNSALADKQLIRSPPESAHSPPDLNIPDCPMNIISSDAREDVKSLISSAQSTPRNELTSCSNNNIPDSSMERASSDGEEDVSMLQLAPPQKEHVPCSDNDNTGPIDLLDERNEPGCSSPETVVAASVNINRVDEEENNIPGCSLATTTPEVVLMITDNNDNEIENGIEMYPNDQNLVPEPPIKAHFENDSLRNQDEMIINNITVVYKSKCRYFEMKESRNYLTLNRLYFTIEDPEELKRQWIYLFFREYSHDLQNILSFLDNVPFLNQLTTQEIVAQLKKISFSIWTVWCLYGIGKKKLILPNGRYLDREALRSVFRSEVLDRFFKVPCDFFKLDLNPTEISLLILVLFVESAELTLSEYCWNMLEDIILKRENGDRILIELMKRIDDLMELNGRISRSRRMTQMIDAIRCLK